MSLRDSPRRAAAKLYWLAAVGALLAACRSPESIRAEPLESGQRRVYSVSQARAVEAVRAAHSQLSIQVVQEYDLDAGGWGLIGKGAGNNHTRGVVFTRTLVVPEPGETESTSVWTLVRRKVALRLFVDNYEGILPAEIERLLQ